MKNAMLSAYGGICHAPPAWAPRAGICKHHFRDLPTLVPRAVEGRGRRADFRESAAARGGIHTFDGAVDPDIRRAATQADGRLRLCIAKRETNANCGNGRRLREIEKRATKVSKLMASGAGAIVAAVLDVVWGDGNGSFLVRQTAREPLLPPTSRRVP